MFAAIAAAGVAAAVGGYYLFTSPKSRVYHYAFAKATLKNATNTSLTDQNTQEIKEMVALSRDRQGRIRTLDIDRERLMSEGCLEWGELLDPDEEIGTVRIDYSCGNKDYVVTYVSHADPHEPIRFPPSPSSSEMSFPVAIISAVLRTPSTPMAGTNITDDLRTHAGPRCDFHGIGARFCDILDDALQPWRTGMIVTLIDTQGRVFFYDLDEEPTINWPADAEEHGVRHFMLRQSAKIKKTKPRSNHLCRELTFEMAPKVQPFALIVSTLSDEQ